MGWFSLGIGGSSSSSTKDETVTKTPIISPQYNAAFGQYQTPLNTSGANAQQQQAITFAQNQMDANSNPVNQASSTANAALQRNIDYYKQISQKNIGAIGTADPRQLGATPQSQAATSAGTSTVGGYTGAQYAQPYSQLYSQQLIDPSLKAYDYGTDRAFSALDARSAGNFANGRNGLGYSDLGTQSALQRGQLEAGLKTTGLNAAFGFGQTDASRQQNADVTNAANTLNNNQFNAGLLTQNNQYNAGLLDSDAKFNVNAGYQGDQQRLQAANQLAQNVAASTGLSQQQLANVITANGVNTEAATALFNAGSITQEQLQAIMQAAKEYNGSTSVDHGKSTGKGFHWGANAETQAADGNAAAAAAGG